MTKILILSGHPRPESFTEHLAKSYQNGANKAGFETELFKLHELNLSQKAVAQKPTSSDWTPQLTALWEAFERADHVMIAHPLWWGSMPGELKMLFDRLLISGKAYSYEEGKPLPLGHLAGRTAEIIMTSDTPNWFYKLGYKSAQTNLMKNQILKFIGLKPTRFTHISPVRSMSDKERQRQIEKAFQLGQTAPKTVKQKSAA